MQMLARLMVVSGIVLICVSGVSADTFGQGANQFTIDFVTISGSTNPDSGYGIVNNDYRMGVYEITNNQWYKFKASLGVPVTGDPSDAYNANPYYTGMNMPTNEVSWYEAAQFVNWLNTSTGHHVAYKFIGTQGTKDYTFGVWDPSEADNGTNLYRHKDAMYYLPTDDEWGKAAFWNGTILQDYATKVGESLHQGDGVSGTGWNYWDNGYVTDPYGPWDVGSGSEELNGTYDMMGNLWEWIENAQKDPNYGTDSNRALRGGSWGKNDPKSSYRYNNHWPHHESYGIGFRVASDTEMLNNPPTALCQDVTVAADDQCQVIVPLEDVDGGSYDPDGDPIELTLEPMGPYALGTTTVTLKVADDKGESDSCTATITVVDAIPPTVTVADMLTIWPPNHKYHTFTLSDLVTHVEDPCGGPIDIEAAATIVSIYSDEPEDARGGGDGQTVDDIVILNDNSFQIRAERQGDGNGRVHGVNIDVVDLAGNITTVTGYICVPHNQSGEPPIDDGPESGYVVP